MVAKACKYGQFTHSPSQVALTHLFDFVGDDEILINSGHNPDYCQNIGLVGGKIHLTWLNMLSY